METADKDLCIELFDLTGLSGTYFWSYRAREGTFDMWDVQRKGMDTDLLVPRYTLGELIRLLPPYIDTSNALKISWDASKASWKSRYDRQLHVRVARTIENSLCKLAIELAKQGKLNG